MHDRDKGQKRNDHLLRFALPSGIEFAILLIATTTGCAFFYVAGRSIGWVRPLIGQ